MPVKSDEVELFFFEEPSVLLDRIAGELVPFVPFFIPPTLSESGDFFAAFFFGCVASLFFFFTPTDCNRDSSMTGVIIMCSKLLLYFYALS